MPKLKILSKKLTPEHVKTVKINLSETCFFRCQMCSHWKIKENPDFLGLDIYRKFFENLKQLKGPHTRIQFTGGETLSCPEVYNLVAIASKNFHTEVLTNGWLINEKNIQKLFDAKLDGIVFSLDGSYASLHDKIRGTPDSYNRVMSGAKDIKEFFSERKQNIDVGITTVISALNLYDIVSLVKLVDKAKFLDSISLNAVAAPLHERSIIKGEIDGKKWYDHDKFKHLWPKDKDVIKEVYAELISLKKQGALITEDEHHLKMQYNYFMNPNIRIKNNACTVFDELSVNMHGDIFHCYVKNEKIGNIKNEDIQEIWKSQHTQDMRKRVINCDINCHQLLNCAVPE